jgi:hypothetical protein
VSKAATTVLTQNNSARICRSASIDLHEIAFGRDQQLLGSAVHGKQMERTRGPQGERVPELGSSLTRCLEELKRSFSLDMAAVTIVPVSDITADKQSRREFAEGYFLEGC